MIKNYNYGPENEDDRVEELDFYDLMDEENGSE